MVSEIILPYIPDEVRYVLKEHREPAGSAVEGAPVWWLKPLTLKEQAEAQDGSVRARIKRAQPGATDAEDPELDMLAAAQELKVLMRNVIRVETLRGYDESGQVVELELPAPSLGGAAGRQREAVLRRLKPSWRRELAKAIMDDSWLSEAEEKN